MNTFEFIPENLRAARQLLGLSQLEMGQLAGMSQKDISLHEKDGSDKKLIPLRYIVALVAKGVDMNSLFRKGEVRLLSRTEQLAAEPPATYLRLRKAASLKEQLEESQALLKQLGRLGQPDVVERLLRLAGLPPASAGEPSEEGGKEQG